MSAAGSASAEAPKPKIDFYNYAIKGNFPCIHCDDDIVGIFAHCVTCEKKGNNINLCINCLRYGAIVNDHEPHHSYVYQDVGGFVPFEGDDADGWNLIELQRLHSAVCKVGMNWEKVAEIVRTRDVKSCRKTWLKFFMKHSIGKPCWEEARARFDKRFEDTNWSKFDDLKQDSIVRKKQGLLTKEAQQAYTYDPIRGDFECLPLNSLEKLLDFEFPSRMDEKYKQAMRLYQIDRYNRNVYDRIEQIKIAKRFALAFDFANGKKLDYAEIRKKDPFFVGLPKLRKPVMTALAEEGKRANELLKPFAAHTRGTPYEYIWKSFMMERDLRDRIAEMIGLKPSLSTVAQTRSQNRRGRSRAAKEKEASGERASTKIRPSSAAEKLAKDKARLQARMAKINAKIAEMQAAVAEADKVQATLAAAGKPGEVKILVVKGPDGKEYYKAVKTHPRKKKSKRDKSSRRDQSGESRSKSSESKKKSKKDKADRSEKEKRDSSKSKPDRASAAKSKKVAEAEKKSSDKKSKSKDKKTKDAKSKSAEKVKSVERRSKSSEVKKKKKKEKEKRSQSVDVRKSSDGKKKVADGKTKEKPEERKKSRRKSKSKADGDKKSKKPKLQEDKSKKMKKRRREKDDGPDGSSSAKKRKLDDGAKKAKKHRSKKEKQTQKEGSPEIVEVGRVSGEVEILAQTSPRVSVGSRPGTSGLSARVSVGTRPGTSGLPSNAGRSMPGGTRAPPPKSAGTPKPTASDATKNSGSRKPPVPTKSSRSSSRRTSAIRPPPPANLPVTLDPLEAKLVEYLKMQEKDYRMYRSYLFTAVKRKLANGKATKLPPGLPKETAGRILKVLGALKMLPAAPPKPKATPTKRTRRSAKR